jgi:arsenate reductase
MRPPDNLTTKPELMPPPALPIVLILCTGNSCRSQMAEGILHRAAAGMLDARSAGSKPAGYVHTLAVQAMAEIGIDISGHHSKSMDGFLQQDVETVITVCGNADQACPMFPGQLNRHHWGFDDPAHAPGGEAEPLAVFRRVRDEIKRVFEAYVAGRRDEAKALAGKGEL